MEHNKISEHIDSSLCMLIEALECALSTGTNKVNTMEMGQVADAVKDLSEAKMFLAKEAKEHAQACYYHEVVEAMEASEGEEHRYGYIDPMDKHASERSHMQRWMHGQDARKPEMGEHAQHDDRYGKPYNSYLESRRRYTESKSQADKDSMEMYANEHMSDTMTSLKEIHRMADPEMRKQMKASLTKFIGELPA